MTLLIYSLRFANLCRFPTPDTAMDLNTYLNRDDRTAADLARALGISPVLISQWRTGRRPIPAERCPEIEKATGGAVRCESLRPDVDWAFLRQSCL